MLSCVSFNQRERPWETPQQCGRSDRNTAQLRYIVCANVEAVVVLSQQRVDQLDALRRNRSCRYPHATLVSHRTTSAGLCNRGTFRYAHEPASRYGVFLSLANTRTRYPQQTRQEVANFPLSFLAIASRASVSATHQSRCQRVPSAERSSQPCDHIAPYSTIFASHTSSVVGCVPQHSSRGLNGRSAASEANQPNHETCATCKRLRSRGTRTSLTYFRTLGLHVRAISYARASKEGMIWR